MLKWLSDILIGGSIGIVLIVIIVLPFWYMLMTLD